MRKDTGFPKMEGDGLEALLMECNKECGKVSNKMGQELFQTILIVRRLVSSNHTEKISHKFIG